MSKHHNKKVLPKKERMEKAAAWLPKFQGKHVIHAYRVRYGVRRLTATRELAELGAITPEHLAILESQEAARTQRIRERLAKKKAGKKGAQGSGNIGLYTDSDATFAYIAGYTPGGAPYGVTWEEMGLPPWGIDDEDEDPDDFPF